MTLNELIELLEACPNQDMLLPIGIKNPDSWRGSYDEIAFEPGKDVPLQLLLQQCKDTIGTTFTGYKGGDYVMDGNTDINIDEYGAWSDNNAIWEILIKLMLNQNETITN